MACSTVRIDSGKRSSRCYGERQDEESSQLPVSDIGFSGRTFPKQNYSCNERHKCHIAHSELPEDVLKNSTASRNHEQQRIVMSRRERRNWLSHPLMVPDA